MALRLGVDLRLFHILYDRKEQAVKAAELADITRAEFSLIGRERKVPIGDRKAERLVVTSTLDESYYSNWICKGDRCEDICVHVDDGSYLQTYTRGIHKNLVSHLN